MVIARGAQSAGFDVSQSDYHPDESTNKFRETDVTASLSKSADHGQIILSFVIECKSSKSNPWLLFTYDHGYQAGLSIVRRATSSAGRSILSKLQFNSELHESSLFKLPKEAAYGLTLGLRGDVGKDNAKSSDESKQYGKPKDVDVLYHAQSF